MQFLDLPFHACSCLDLLGGMNRSKLLKILECSQESFRSELCVSSLNCLNDVCDLWCKFNGRSLVRV